MVAKVRKQEKNAAPLRTASRLPPVTGRNTARHSPAVCTAKPQRCRHPSRARRVAFVTWLKGVVPATSAPVAASQVSAFRVYTTRAHPSLVVRATYRRKRIFGASTSPRRRRSSTAHRHHAVHAGDDAQLLVHLQLRVGVQASTHTNMDGNQLDTRLLLCGSVHGAYLRRAALDAKSSPVRVTRCARLLEHGAGEF